MLDIRVPARNSVQRTVLWAVGSLGLLAILTFTILFAVSTRLQQRLNRQTAVLLMDETIAETALNLGHQQMLMAARYVYTPDTAIEARFRELGQQFYQVLREYLRRDLTQDERRRVERIKEAHEQLEVNAFDAFSYARAGQHELARERSSRMARNADVLQQEITAFLFERRPQRAALEDRFTSTMRWVYGGAALSLLLVALGVWVIARLLRARLVTPLQELEDAAARVAPGSAPLQVRPSGVAEIHAVADSFQQMSTRLLNAQQQTTEAHERFRALIENASDTVTVVDASGATIYSGPSLTRVLGYDPEERAGRSVLEIVHPDDVRGATELLHAALERRVDVAVINIRARHADGSWRWLEVKARNLLDHPAVRGVVMNSADITERKQAELALESSEEQLRQAQKMEAIGRLAAGVAHDFNNILTTIHGYLDLILEQSTAQAVREDLIQVKVAADRAVDLTKQLLAFGRKQMLQPEVLNICAAVQDVQRMLTRLIGEDVEFVVKCHARDAHAKVDRGQLHQILMNLAVNARDAMPRGGRLLIAVSAEEAREPLADQVPAGPYVVLRVSDTGTGMDEDTAARIFEPFFTTKPVGQGTGLGLSTVYGIVKQSGGHIAVKSQEGAGTTFTIWLPRAQPVTDERAEPDAGTAPLASTRGATVLVAEDDAAVRSLVERMLRRHGYHVITAVDGREAVDKLNRHGEEIDVVVADVIMPRGGGAEIAAALAREEDGIPLILMSGYSEEELLEHVRAINHNVTFISKPYSAVQLLKTIDRALERRRSS